MAYENPRIEKTFTWPMPDEWRSTEFTAGRTGTWTYKGPRFLTFEIDKESGRENGWCLTTERELEKPCPLNAVRITVDCTLNDENALVCEIANDHGDPAAVEFRTFREWKILHEGPPGYNHTWYTDEMEPRDIYDEFSITYDFETGKFNLPVKGWENEGRMDVTWDDIKELRNKFLSDTDGKISDDMPAELQQKWRDYRQLLRDLPTALAHIPPFQAAKMFPTSPEYKAKSKEIDPRIARDNA
jgi:hypothetical protein